MLSRALVPVAVAALALSTPAAGAPKPAPFPRYDVDKNCRRHVGGDTLGDRISIPALNACVEAEQQGYELGRIYWRELPAAAREACLPIAAREPNLPYTRLKDCLYVAVRREEARRHRRFEP